MNNQQHSASFRDPAGFIFIKNGTCFRQVNKIYKSEYDHLMLSGLYKRLTEEGLLISHTEEHSELAVCDDMYKLLLPDQLSLISYPYEWSFDMLRDAALLTLSINKIAIEFGMVLKDASSYNVQFRNGEPVFIDTLSFDFYDSSRPWVAYRQFCQHFLFPLLLVKHTGVDAIRWLSLYIDGVPLNVCARLMPWKATFNLPVLLHVKLQHFVANGTGDGHVSAPDFSRKKMDLLLSGLELAIRKLSLKKYKSGWHMYYTDTILGEQYLAAKTKIVDQWLNLLKPASILDAGCNKGHFSFLFANKVKHVIAFDADPQSVNELYLANKKNRWPVSSLVIDLANPSASVGWGNEERSSFLARCSAELGLFLAILHHLFFVFDIPFNKIVELMKQLCRDYVIVEFVLQEDEKLVQISRSKQHLLPSYTIGAFEDALSRSFTVEKKIEMPEWNRILYLLKSY